MKKQSKEQSNEKQLNVLWQSIPLLPDTLNVRVLQKPQRNVSAKFIVQGAVVELGPVLYVAGIRFMTPEGLYELRNAAVE